jgi:tRNA(Ile)-lysidine synthase
MLMLKQQVMDTIKKNGLINYGEGIVVGVSGGYDSVCLLHILFTISSELNIKLYPVHINHMLRGEEALRDENFVKELCLSLGLDLHVEKIEIAKKAVQDKLSIEEAGRNARYEVFGNVAKEKAAAKIAVAHSRNDQAETILMRIFRGTGLEGLKGMEYKRDNIIRPLLDVDRSQIESYVNKNGLEAITDSSNLHTDYYRNRIRLNVLPEINSASKTDITENLLRLSKIVVADEDFLRYNAELYYEKAIISEKSDRIELDLAELKKMHQAMIGRVLRMAVFTACGSIVGLGYVHIEKLVGLIENGRTGARVDIPLGMMALKSYTSIIIGRQVVETHQNFEYRLEIPGKTVLGMISATVTTQLLNFETNTSCFEFINKNKDAFTKFIDFGKLDKEKFKDIMVRNRRDGDTFKPLNSNGTKKLKEYFIDNKIPREERNDFPLIAINKEIIWIIGNKTSDNYRVTDNTNSVLMITFAYNKKNVEAL